MNKTFDLILYGATGFVGQQAIAYLAKHAASNTRWAIAGRSLAKLEAARDAVAHEHPSVKEMAMVVADAQDEKALSTLAASTRVVLSCAGPYALYGSKLVAACVKHQTHYCDITGETPWIRQMIDAHHAKAEKDGTRIVPSCGFDSVPSDLGAYLLLREMKKRHKQDCIKIKAAFSLGGGGLNGGTLASVMNMIESKQSKALNDPFLLNPAGTVPKDVSAHRDPLGAHHDEDFNAWLGLFVMGPVNTRVVRRSLALRGQQASYQEYLRFGRSLVAGAVAGSFGVGSKISMGLLEISPLRKLAQRMMAQPGQGPSAASMARGFFKIDVIGQSAQGHQLRVVIGDSLDAGNGATVKMMCESALALAENEDQLPKASGVITPSVALGEVLERRLAAAGMRVEISG
ncbi:saccharopine dehydrogenase NADP-binding domain-containing protein [Variovorax sp. PCZ-1]|uniref:saccharopine dehydrogenase family protein n=1 Tax=Variovorax sp. PCZ-1 TaxID=2835533 RepID=UPI001BD14BB9|nr:saccharopine dehydrogenase NADP-binding domain-containing protein [Variovorax sp. PCZ-1]MBS7806926.1 saccharopine dehydrogenase NADP-binding domain-containing protein [Variovorax sp. PCZ-1]